MILKLQLIKWVFAIGTILLCVNCKKEKIAVQIDLIEQRAEDIEIIENYIADHNLGEFDTTKSGARYIIQEVGDGDSINYKDIVAIDYIGYSIDRNVFDTSIREVADTAFTESSNAVLKPQVFTYTESGWSVELIQLTSQFIVDGFIPGRALTEAITDALINMKTGGKLIVFLPSDQAFEGRPTTFFDSYSVVFYEIFPVRVF